MSVIAAKVYPDRIDIASDSILIKEDTKKTNFKKIYNTAHICAGGCGSAEELSLFFSFISGHKPEEESVTGVLNFMKSFSKWKFEYTNDDVIHNCYIIIFRKKLFEVDGLFVQEIKDYTAIGEGEDFAMAALHLGHTVKEAVQVACDLSCYVSAPIACYNVMFKEKQNK